MCTKSFSISGCLILCVNAAFVSVRAGSYQRNSFYQSGGVSPVLQKTLTSSRTLLPPSFPPFSPPCRSLWKIIGVHWEHYWFGLGVLGEKVKLYLVQNTDQRGKNWPCFRRPFTSNLCLFSFFFFPFLLLCLLVHFCLFFLHFVLSVCTPCLSVFFWFM